MHHRPATLLAVLLTASLALPAFAASACQIYAYANDPDPAGLNVRQGPSLKYSVIGVLKSADYDGYQFSPEFMISDFKNGFYKIGDAVTGQYGDGPEETVFQGPGWVSARLTGFEIEDPHLYEAPTAGSATILDLDNAWSLDTTTITAIHGCLGPYVHVTLTNASGSSATGWATDLCGNQATTCS